MAHKLSLLESLPSEILDIIISSFPTPELIKLSSVSQRLYDLVSDQVYRRLLHGVTLPDFQIILECYIPSAKNSTPYLYCDYLGTNGLDHGTAGAGTPIASAAGQHSPRTIRNLSRLYSRFRPVPHDDVRTRMSRTRRGSLAGILPLGLNSISQPLPTTTFSLLGNAGPNHQKPPALRASQEVQVDCDMRFTQLCMTTNLVKKGPRRGLFLSCVNINDTFVRVFRDWLRERGKESLDPDHIHNVLDEENSMVDARGDVQFIDHDNAILWIDNDRYVGLRFKVVETTAEHYDNPMLTPPAEGGLDAEDDESRPVSYRLEYEELLIRSCRLLLSAEKAAAQEKSPAGKSVIIARG